MNILGITSAETLIWCVAIGAALASVYAFYTKSVIGKIIRRLDSAKAYTKESAKTLDELGCNSFLCRFALREGSLQDGAVSSMEDGKFFMLEAQREKLLAKCGTTDTSALSLGLVLLVIAVIGAIAAAVYPSVAGLLGGLFN